MTPTKNIHLNLTEFIFKLFNDSDTFNLCTTNGYLQDTNGSMKYLVMFWYNMCTSCDSKDGQLYFHSDGNKYIY